MRRPIAVAAFVVLVVFAGCLSSLPGGTPGDDGGTPDDAGTTTGAGEPELDLSDVSLPDGVSEDGVNVSRLVASHETAMEADSFTIHISFEENQSSGSAQSLTVDARVAEGGTPRSATLDSTSEHVELYLDEETEYLQRTADGETRYDVRPRTPEVISAVPVSPSGGSYIRQLAGPMNFTATGVQVEDGTPLVVLTGQDVTSDVSVSVADLNATMLVDERGVVHEVSMTFTVEGDSTRTIAFGYDLSDVGSTTVEKPDWFDEVEDRAGS